MSPFWDGVQSVFTGRVNTFPPGPRRDDLERRARLLRALLVVAIAGAIGVLVGRFGL